MKRIKQISFVFLAFIATNVLLWLLFINVIAPPNRVTVGTNGSEPVDIVEASKVHGSSGILGDIDSGMLSSLSIPSLKMKENVDFLLTPALLVQECISEDVLITYPQE